jgi:hypothetical protein
LDFFVFEKVSPLVERVVGDVVELVDLDQVILGEELVRVVALVDWCGQSRGLPQVVRLGILKKVVISTSLREYPVDVIHGLR